MVSPFRSARSLSCLLLLALTLTMAQAQRGAMKPDDLFLQGHSLMRQSRKLESEGDFEGAATKCRQAIEVYNSLSAGWRNWNASIVDERRKKVRRTYERLKKLAVEQGNSGLELPQRGPIGPGIEVRPQGRPGAVAPVPRALSPRQRMQQLEREVERLNASRNKLIQQSQEQHDNTTAANRALGLERSKVRELEAQLKTKQDELKRLEGVGTVALKNQVDALTKQLEEATEGLKTANEQRETILGEYESALEQIAELKQQGDELTQQRDEMAAILEGLQTEGSSLELITENARLREQLNAAQARVDQLEMEKIEDEAEITTLREEVSQLRTELAVLKKENEEYKQRLINMQDMLADNVQESTFNPPSAENPIDRQENEILRGIIRRKLKQQKFNQQKREIIIAELQGLESASDDLIAKIKSLGNAAPLSPEEQAALEGSQGTIATLTAASPIVGNARLDKKIARYIDAAAYNFEKGRFEEAELHYEEILTFAPKHLESLCNLGVTKTRLNDVVGARRVLERGTLLDDNHARAHYLLGVVCYYLEDVDQSIISIRQAMEIEPGNSEYPAFLGTIYLVREELEKAISFLQQAVELDPRNAHAHYNLCIALVTQPAPDMARAFKHYSEAKKLDLPADERMERTFRESGFLKEAS